MNEQIVVDIEQSQRRSAARISPETQLKKAELSAIMGAEMVVLVSAIGKTVADVWEMKDRRKMRRRLALAACGIALLLGLARLAVQL